jgi:hypothetical protein
MEEYIKEKEIQKLKKVFRIIEDELINGVKLYTVDRKWLIFWIPVLDADKEKRVFSTQKQAQEYIDALVTHSVAKRKIINQI